MTLQFDRIKSAFKRKIENIRGNFEKTIVSNPSFIDTMCVNPENSVPVNPSSRGNIVFGPVPSRRLGYSLGINDYVSKSMYL